MKDLKKHQLIAIGRSIAVLYGALCLVAFASAASRTERPAPVDAEQYADFMGNEVLDIQDLAEGAEVQRRMFNRITPPGLSWTQPMFPPVAPFDAQYFDEQFLEGLLGEDKNSVAIYPLSLIQDPQTRETLIYNAEGELIAAIPVDGAVREWPEDADPSRVILQLDLLPAEDVEPYLYTERRIEESLARYNASRSAKSGGAATRGLEAGEFGICNIQRTTNGTMFITVTNGASVAEVFAYTVWHTSSVVVVTWTNEQSNVVTDTNTVWHQVSPAFNGLESAWECLTTNLVLTNGVGIYEDANISSNARIRFYAVANRQDTDGDGLTDGAEIFVHHTNPALTDTDGDGLSDWGEIHLYGTNPLGADTDGDGMPDGWEIGHGLNPLLDDGGLDGDGDGLSNHQEYLLGTNPNNADTDGDGLPDGWEVQHELNALNATGEDGADGDPDGDGFSNLQEFLMQGEPRHPGLSPEQLVFHFMHCRGSSSLRVDVEDSHVCGGMNNVRQEVTDIYHVPPLLRCSAYLLRVTVKGAVEDHQENFDIVSLKTDPFFCALREETEYFRGNDNGNECEMATKTETKDIWFHNRGTVTLMYDTVDALFHSNAYAEVTAASFVKKAPYPDHFFKLDLDVDTDRNHAVHDVLDEEGEDGWTLSRGALVSPRIRIDPYGTNPVQGLAKLVIQRPDPLLNETPSKSMRIRLPDSNTRQYLWMVDAGGTNINFDSSGCYTLPLWPSNGATFYAASSYSRKYNDGLPVRFDIELELLISNQVVCSDNVRLTVAPLILPPECYPAEKVYSLCFELSGITMLNTTATSAFIQDMVKFTKCQIHSNATHTVAVPLDHSRAGNLDAVLRVDEKIPSLAIWPFLGDGGNIMATPPLGPHAPYGKIMLGTKNQLSAPQWARQGLQPEILTVDTSWLLVGHVDEIVMFTATNKMLVADPWKAADLLHEEIVSGCATQTLWWGTASNHVGAARTTTVAKVVIATNAAGQFKRSHLPTGGLPDSTNPVTIVFSNAVFATGDYLRVNHEILSVLSANGPVTRVARAQGGRPSQAHAEDDVIYALSDAMRLNLSLGNAMTPVDHIATFTNAIRAAVGDAIEFVPMPVLFDWVEQGDDNGFLAATPNLVNSVVMNESRVIMPAPGIACFKNYAEEHVPGAEFHDSWIFHVHRGNMHCATAAIRSLPAVPPFWEQVESWE